VRTLPTVDRRLFVPDVVYVLRDGEFVPVDRDQDPDGWEKVVADPGPVVTQLGDYGVGFGMPTSSASGLEIVGLMIEALNVEPGMRVLEIGTGTGFNAACLAALGARVVSVEIDPDLADHARAALHGAGFADVVVVTGDGELGAPELAPFDRVICTAAAHTVPYAWVRQTRDAGIIVTPYTGEGCKYGTLVLHVKDGKATGGIEGDAAFMPLRGQFLTPMDKQAIQTTPGLRVEVTESGQRLITPTMTTGTQPMPKSR
jgi:protein-L-isoaspartate(D-aspartate) O-methyltransferase